MEQDSSDKKPNDMFFNDERRDDMNRKHVKDSPFLSEYTRQMTRVLSTIYPNKSKEKIHKIVAKRVEETLMNPEGRVENSYTGEGKPTTLLSVLDYLMDRKPIIGANATFFKHHEESINPNIVMLDGFDQDRTAAKGRMFAAKEAGDKEKEDMENIDQKNFKVLSNSWYGGGAMPGSAFYNKEVSASTTKTARAVISTCMTTFEAVLGNTFTFVDVQEFFFWVHTVFKEDVTLDEWVVRKTSEEAFDRLFDRIIMKESNDEEIVRKYMKTLTIEQSTRLYWKYNLLEFTKTHPIVRELYHTIYSSIQMYEPMRTPDDFSVVPERYRSEIKGAKDPQKAWTKKIQHELFYDPNNAPDSIKANLQLLSDTYVKYIYVEYMFTDRMYKLKNFRRNVVTVIDTDSNILSLDPWIEYCFTKLMHGDYGRRHIDNVFININTITYVISSVIGITLDLYGRHSNITKEHRKRYKMKNEFFFSRLILANVKKRYLNKMLLQEGNLLTKPTYDIKGYDFKKASTSDDASEFYMGIVKDKLLDAETINVAEILVMLRDFRSSIRESLKRGETTYLPIGSPKEIGAYVNPNSNQNLRSLFAWNALYPDNQITLPAKVAILKTKLTTLDSAKGLAATHPDIYQKLKTKIFEDKTGMFVKYKNNDSGEKVEGLSVIAIPKTESIPEWLIPYIDYTTVVNAVLAPFKSVTETFGLPSIEEGPTERRSVGFTNIVRL